jgi:AcrR family transcriptional regulator
MTKEATREHILAVAAALFARKGFAEASMNDIVDASGVSKGGIYWHFKGKDEIVNAIYVQFFEAQMAGIQHILAQHGTASERLLLLAHAAGEAAAQLDGEAQFPHVLDFYAQALRQPVLLQTMQHYLGLYVQQLATLIQQGVDAGEFAPCDARETALALVSGLDGIVLVSSLLDGADLAARLETVMQLYLNGLLQRPAAKGSDT